MLAALLLTLMAARLGPAPATTGEEAVFAGQPVYFQDRSLGRPDTWEWDFDYDFLFPTIDSYQADPTWTFSQAGTYAVRLRVCNPFGCDTKIRLLEVLPAPDEPQGIFEDGFESGDTSRWSASLP